MTRTARGTYEQREGLTPAPTVRIAVGFGRDRVVALEATVDTGSDICVFPMESLRSVLPGEPETILEIRYLEGDSHNAPAYFPSITLGDLRETRVAVAVIDGGVPVLGRSLLNRLHLELDAGQNLVALKSSQSA